MSNNESTGSFVLNGAGGRLMVDVIGYENPRPQTISDANWLRARVRLEAGGCTLRIDAALTTQDVKHFLQQLEGVIAALEGSASLTTDEESMSLRVKVSKTGTAQVAGEIREYGAAILRVEFEFESDQSFLMGTLSDLRDLQRRCPVIDSV